MTSGAFSVSETWPQSSSTRRASSICSAMARLCAMSTQRSVSPPMTSVGAVMSASRSSMSMRLSSSACSGGARRELAGHHRDHVLDAAAEQLEGVAAETVSEHVARAAASTSLR